MPRLQTISIPGLEAAIRARYDSSSEALDSLSREFGCKRSSVLKLAARMGLSRPRREWTRDEEHALRTLWGTRPQMEIAAMLGRSWLSLVNRRKRLGLSLWNNPDPSILDLERLMKIEHRASERFISAGELAVYEEYGKTEVAARRVRLADLHAFLRARPEVCDWRALPSKTRDLLELNAIPAPPAAKLLTCRSTGFDDRVRAQAVGPKYTHGHVEIAPRQHTYSLDSCATLGGFDFWTPLYDNNPTCPRCGCLASRYSAKRRYSEAMDADSGRMAMLADKLGLSYRDAGLHDTSGRQLDTKEVFAAVFGTKRRASCAGRTFAPLLRNVLGEREDRPVRTTAPNLLGYSLTPGQQAHMADFLAHGHALLTLPPGDGKMFIAAMALTIIPGEHILFTNTRLLRESWINHLRRYAPRVAVRQVWSPFYHYEVKVFDHEGAQRCRIVMSSYLTRRDFSNQPFTVAIFDEAHHLPSNKAHRLSFLPCQHAMGLTATPMREDGRDCLIGAMTGREIGGDWQDPGRERPLPKVPIRVIVVESTLGKDEAVRRLLKRSGRTIVFCDAIEPGAELARALGVPFIYSRTPDRLNVLARSRAVVMSRVGDCGLDVPDLSEVIEHTFLFGSRAQELQRFGRLLHSRNPVRHTVLMTRLELSRYARRLRALQSKGFEVRVEIDRSCRGRRPVLPVEAMVPENPLWSALLRGVALDKIKACPATVRSHRLEDDEDSATPACGAGKTARKTAASRQGGHVRA